MRQPCDREGLKGFEVDIHELIDKFVREVGNGASLDYATFKALWKEEQMSFIVASPPAVRDVPNHMQSIFMTILDRLDSPSPVNRVQKKVEKGAQHALLQTGASEQMSPEHTGSIRPDGPSGACTGSKILQEFEELLREDRLIAGLDDENALEGQTGREQDKGAAMLATELESWAQELASEQFESLQEGNHPLGTNTGAAQDLEEPYGDQNLSNWIPFEAKVAALFAVYTSYKVQIYEPKVYIHVPCSILCKLVAMVPELEKRGLWDACEILKVLVQEDAFVFGKYRKPATFTLQPLSRSTTETDLARELVFHLRTSLKGACNSTGVRLHSKRYSDARELLSRMGKWTTGLLGKQGTPEALFDCSVGDRLLKVVSEQQELIEELIADDTFRHRRRPAIMINHHHKKSLDSFDLNGEVNVGKLDLGTQELPTKPSHVRNRLWEEKLKLETKRKRKNKKGTPEKKKARAMNKQALADLEPEEREMLKGLPPRAREVVLRDIQRKRNPIENVPLMSTRDQAENETSEENALLEEPQSHSDNIQADVPGQLPVEASSKAPVEEPSRGGHRSLESESLKIIRTLREKYHETVWRYNYNTRIKSLDVSVEDGKGPTHEQHGK